MLIGFRWRNLKETDHFENPGIDSGIIPKQIWTALLPDTGKVSGC